MVSITGTVLINIIIRYLDLVVSNGLAKFLDETELTIQDSKNKKAQTTSIREKPRKFGTF